MGRRAPAPARSTRRNAAPGLSDELPPPGPSLRPPHAPTPAGVRAGGHPHPLTGDRPQCRGVHRGGRGPAAQRPLRRAGAAGSSVAGAGQRRAEAVSVRLGDLRELQAAGLFASVAGYSTAPIAWTGRPEPEELPALLVSANFFDVLGVHPALGRGFVAGEDALGGPRAVILSDAFWRSRLGADWRHRRDDSQPGRGAHHRGRRAPSGLPLRSGARCARRRRRAATG